MSEERIWLRTDEGIKGPVTLSILKQFVETGKLPPDIQVSEDKQVWRPATQLLAHQAPEVEQLQESSDSRKTDEFEEQVDFKMSRTSYLLLVLAIALVLGGLSYVCYVLVIAPVRTFLQERRFKARSEEFYAAEKFPPAPEGLCNGNEVNGQFVPDSGRMPKRVGRVLILGGTGLEEWRKLPASMRARSPSEVGTLVTCTSGSITRDYHGPEGEVAVVFKSTRLQIYDMRRKVHVGEWVLGQPPSEFIQLPANRAKDTLFYKGKKTLIYSTDVAMFVRCLPED